VLITEIIIIGSSSEDPRSVSCSNRTLRSLNFPSWLDLTEPERRSMTLSYSLLWRSFFFVSTNNVSFSGKILV